MKNIFVLIVLIFMTGCATTKPSKIVVWETKDIPRSHEVIGPVSVSEQIKESNEDAIQGLASFITRDGRVSDQMPADMKTALEIKRERYKEMIYDKLAAKARDYDADAVIGAEYVYVPPYASFSTKATVTAKGTMIKYR
ncbi:MAG TPA: hypothetical protein VD913_02960 [bacterium]|nr:hypothetical protein [bacterium]